MIKNCFSFLIGLILYKHSDVNKTIGMITIRDMGDLTSITLIETYQHQGLGTKILQRLENIYNRNDLPLFIMCFDDMTPWMLKMKYVKLQYESTDGSYKWMSENCKYVETEDRVAINIPLTFNEEICIYPRKSLTIEI